MYLIMSEQCAENASSNLSTQVNKIQGSTENVTVQLVPQNSTITLCN